MGTIQYYHVQTNLVQGFDWRFFIKFWFWIERVFFLPRLLVQICKYKVLEKSVRGVWPYEMARSFTTLEVATIGVRGALSLTEDNFRWPDLEVYMWEFSV